MRRVGSYLFTGFICYFEVVFLYKNVIVNLVIRNFMCLYIDYNYLLEVNIRRNLRLWYYY